MLVAKPLTPLPPALVVVVVVPEPESPGDVAPELATSRLQAANSDSAETPSSAR